MTLPDDFIPDRVEQTRGLQPAIPAQLLTLEQRLGLRLVARRIAARISSDPAVASGITRNRERALLWQREIFSPGRFEIGLR